MLSLVLVAAGPLIVNGHRKSSSWVMTMSEAAFVFKEDAYVLFYRKVSPSSASKSLSKLPPVAEM